MLDPPDDDDYNDGPYDDDFGDDLESLDYDVDEVSANASSNYQNFRNC